MSRHFSSCLVLSWGWVKFIYFSSIFLSIHFSSIFYLLMVKCIGKHFVFSFLHQSMSENWFHYMHFIIIIIIIIIAVIILIKNKNIKHLLELGYHFENKLFSASKLNILVHQNLSLC